MTDKIEIFLDLSSSLNNQFIDIESHQNLQIDSFKQIDNLLTSFKEFASKENIINNVYDSLYLKRKNNTIFIHGERGAGKTTFLHSILAKYKSENKKFISLPLIDPTLVETHQHILIDIVTKLTNLVNNSLTCCKDENNHHKFRESLEKMANGLKLLSSPDDKIRYDAASFLEAAISKSSSGQSLEQNFHEFIDTITSILGCELLIIAIDDVDTKTTKAKEVLEVIRCYLTHPQLVILLSGDLKLYSHIVKNTKQEEVASKTMSDNEDMLVEQLEQQYLLKLLPVDQRINLKKLSDIEKTYPITIRHKNANPTLKIRGLLEDLLLKSLHINKQHLSSHIDFILNQPVRTVLQLMRSLLEAEDNKENKENKENNPSEIFKQALYHGFIGSFVKEKMQLDNISQSSPHINSICFELFKLLYRHGELETGYYARPDSNYDQSGYNAAKLYISSAISNVFSSEKNGNNNISNVFKMMLAGGAVSNIYLTYVANNLEEKHTFDDYLDYIGLNRNERITSLAAHFSPIILDKYDPVKSKAIKAGVIRTPRRKPSTFNENIFENLLKNVGNTSNKRIPSLESLAKKHDNNDWEFVDYVAAKTILISSHYATTTTENRDYISIYGLLASLAELLDDNSDANYTIESLTPIQTYIYPTFLSGKDTGDKDDSDDDNDDREVQNNSSNHSAKLETLIQEWKKTPLNIEVSSLLIGKIWARLNYTLNQISEKSIEKQQYKIKIEKKEETGTETKTEIGTETETGTKYDILLSDLFSRYVWGLINATLIEEFRYNKSLSKDKFDVLSKARNTNTTPDELVKNLKSIESSNINFKESLPITFKLITCPLLWPFISNTSKNSTFEITLYEEIKKIFKTDQESKFLDSFNSFNSEIENKNILQLSIAALPIMGCFKN
ncbi:ATP-binding protein [Providencia sp.]|uniref:ATP-binding protein n=1 Tax=Providencia sp. TaxID=589 RepID=UPI003342D31A